MLVYAVDVSMPPPFLAAAKAALAASLVARAVDHPASDVAVLAYGCRGEGVGGVDGVAVVPVAAGWRCLRSPAPRIRARPCSTG